MKPSAKKQADKLSAAATSLQKPSIEAPGVPLTPYEIEQELRQKALAGGRARTQEINMRLMLPLKRKWPPLYVDEKPEKPPRYNPYAQ